MGVPGRPSRIVFLRSSSRASISGRSEVLNLNTTERDLWDCPVKSRGNTLRPLRRYLVPVAVCAVAGGAILLVDLPACVNLLHVRLPADAHPQVDVVGQAVDGGLHGWGVDVPQGVHAFIHQAVVLFPQ